MSVYFERYAHADPLIKEKPSPKLGLVVTVPCYDEPELTSSLASLAYCHPGRMDAEVIVVINHSEQDSAAVKRQNQVTYHKAQEFAEIYSAPHLRFHILLKELPAKHAGVGLARKIAMDEAARRLNSVGKQDGVISCFDADSLCLDNYLLVLEHFFESYPNSPGCSIYFEHPLDGKLDEDIYHAITDYELFLRYYVHALRYAGFPHAYQTIGSSMAVRNNAYQKQGGMNKRKAGEDFYFLHKIIPLGGFGEVNGTKVIPSPRKSNRVPFGTGKAVNDWMAQKALSTYHLDIFKDLLVFYTQLRLLEDYNDLKIKWFKSLPKPLFEFGKTIELYANVDRIKQNSGHWNTFIANFHKWFDGFKVLKYVHFARDNFYPNVPIQQAAQGLLERIHGVTQAKNNRLLLEAYRSLDRKSN